MTDFKPMIHTYTTPKDLTVNVYLVGTENNVVVEVYAPYRMAHIDLGEGRPA